MSQLIQIYINMKTKFNGILTLLLAFVVQFTFAQEKTISGVVSDESGPLPGVSVVIKGTTTGTETDFDGKYILEANTGDVLVYSFIGMTTKNATVGTNNTINIVLASDNVLEEVVVTALGLEKKKDDDLSSTSVVKVDQLQRSGEAGVLQSLSGKTSGVNITRNSGDPGAGAYIQIRGQNTILGDNSPLIVIDGAIVSNSAIGGGTGGVVQQSRLNDINPEDIESVSVLKGASAAAIYGTGAANGVLVIKTKRGAKGGKKWQVNVKSSLSIDQINREWSKQEEYGQGFPNAWFGLGGYSGIDWPSASTSYGSKISTRTGGADDVDTTGQYFEADSGTKYYPITGKNSKETYNQINRDAVFKDGYSYDNNVSFSFNGDNNRTFVSLSNLSQDGIYRGAADYKRTSIRLNSDTDFTDKLTFKLSTTYVDISSNRVQTGSNLNGLYLGYLRTSPDFDIRDYKGTNFSASGIPTPNSHRSYRRYLGSSRTFDAEAGTFQYSAPTYNNPLWTLNQQKNLNEVDRFIVAPEIVYKLNSALSLTGRYSLDYYQDNRINYWPAGSAGDGSQGLFKEDRITEKNSNYNLFLTGNYDVSDNFGLGFTTGMQLFENTYKRLSAEETSFTNPDEVFINTGNAVSTNSNPSDYIENTRKSGVFALVNFDLWDQFMVELTGRGEYVSTINTGFVFYPSASVGWNFTKHLNDSKVISFGKLRASYGEVGIEPTPYNTRTVITTDDIRSGWGDGFDGSLYGNPLTRSRQRGNPDLTIERIKEIELGFDTRFFNNRLSLSATYYDRTSEDVVLELPTPASNGFTSELRNAATITNKGLELDLTAKIVNTEDFKWNMNLSYTTNKNLVTNMFGSDYYTLNGFSSTSSGVAEGQPFAVLRGGVYERDANGKFVLNDFGFPNAAATKEFVGDPNPDWRGGFGTNISYKGITLSAALETVQGNDVWNGTRGVLNFFGVHAETAIETVASQDLLNAEGSTIPAGTTFRGYEADFGGGPVAVDYGWWTSNGGGFGDVSEIFIEDASWTRLREVTLAYSLPKTMTKKLGIENIQLSVTGRNLALWTNIEGFDPDNNLTGASKGRGLEYFSNPGTKSFITTLRISF